MKTITTIKMTALMFISSATLVACGDTEDYYLEPGYGHSFDQQSEMVQLAQVVNQDGTNRTWLDGHLESSQGNTILAQVLRSQAPNALIENMGAFDQPFSDEEMERALDGNPLEVTPPIHAPTRLEVQNMTPEELKRTCVAIDSIFDGMDATDMNTADCTANRLENVRSVQDEDSETCNITMSKCIDNADTFVPPAAFCQTPNKVPTECEIDYTEIASCLRTFKDSQVQLEAVDICDEGALISTQADAQHDAHQAAKTCLLKLDTHCPSFLQD